MPIKGLSEQRRLPRLGKIHLGIKKVSEKTHKEYPVATDYFVLPEDLKAMYPFSAMGDKPTQLSILIPVEDDELWCNQYFKCYSNVRGLTCRGDGVTCRRMIDTATGEKAGRETKDIMWKVGLECAGRECPYYKAKECKETMNLQFIMPDVPGLGVWQIDTSSINSIRNVNSDAELIRAVCKHIAFIPLLLTLEPQEVINPDDGKKKTVRCLHLRIKGTMQELIAGAAKPINELLLPPPPAEDEPPLDTNGRETDEPPMSDADKDAVMRGAFGNEASKPEPSTEKQAPKATPAPPAATPAKDTPTPQNHSANEISFRRFCRMAGYDLSVTQGIADVTAWIKKVGKTDIPFDKLSDEKQKEKLPF